MLFSCPFVFFFVYIKSFFAVVTAQTFGSSVCVFPKRFTGLNNKDGFMAVLMAEVQTSLSVTCAVTALL